jgi:hypothetical protein
MTRPLFTRLTASRTSLYSSTSNLVLPAGLMQLSVSLAKETSGRARSVMAPTYADDADSC